MSKQMTTLNKKEKSLNVRDLFIFGSLLSKKMTSEKVYSFKSLKEFKKSEIFNSINEKFSETVFYSHNNQKPEIDGIRSTSFNQDELICFIETVELMIAMRAIKENEDIGQKENQVLILLRISPSEECIFFEKPEISDRITNIIYAGSSLGLTFVFLEDEH